MTLSPPGPRDTRSALADWLELQALLSEQALSPHSALGGAFDVLDDIAADSIVTDEETNELLDDSILEKVRSEQIDRSVDELDFRSTKLGTVYPFTLTRTGNRVRFTKYEVMDFAAHPGRAIYLFCLLSSAIRENRLQSEQQFAAVERQIANIFQICSCLAAGGYLNGQVSSFGFPRATGTGFIQALRETFDRFGSGEVRDPKDIPDGLPASSLKDGGIDVVAWRDQPDGMPSKLYLLGQCASGINWQDKSVLEYIEQLHGSWFTMSPQTHVMPAMFIPFTFYHDLEERHGVEFLEVAKNYIWHCQFRFGLLFDRMRISHFANNCLSFSPSLQNQIDGTDRLAKVIDWLGQVGQLIGFAIA